MTSCQSNKICLNRSNCQNYQYKSLCLLNQQQYYSGGQIYLRDCTWNDVTKNCQNNFCGSPPISLNTDILCSSKLKGCISKAAGCVDVNESCSSYSGLTGQCEGFKGNNGSQLCTQQISVIDASKQCVDKSSCDQAKTHSVFKNNQASCNSFLKGCYFDGKDNCTNGDCFLYYGTQNYCGSITTAISLGLPQKCWKILNVDNPSTGCIPRECDLAPIIYNTDKLCNTFLNGCVSKGTLIGGCQDKLKNCSQQTGTLSQCLGYIIDENQCSKTTRLCRELVCSNKTPPLTSSTIQAKGQYCQQLTNSAKGYHCQMGSGQIKSCVDPTENSCIQYVALGTDQFQKTKYCYELRFPGNITCGYSKGDFCQASNCSLFNLQDSLQQNIRFCQNLVIDGTIKCGLLNEKVTSCSNRSCDDIGVGSREFCQQYGLNCKWHSLGALCYTQQADCQNYKIPSQFSNSEIQKAQYCNGVLSTKTSPGCAYLSSISATNCSQSPDQCSGFTFPSQVTSNSDKIQFCLAQKLSNGITGCTYQSSQTSCTSISPCSSYLTQENSDLSNQRFCQKFKDLNGYICSFKSTLSSCALPSNNCSDYITYGITINENQQLCSQLKATNSIQCGSITAGISNCKNSSCDDINTVQSLLACSSYNSNCTYDGQNCIPMNSSCSQYNAQTSGQGQQYNCSQLKQIDGAKCGWNTGNKCSTRSCSQLKIGPTLQTCIDYAANCQFDGKNCVNRQDNCTLYIPEGGRDQDKIQICKNLTSLKGKCAFILGTNTCTDVQANCDYKLPASINSQELSLTICSQLFDVNGFICGYTRGDSICSKRQCFQAQIADSDLDCNNFHLGCEQDNNSSCSTKTCKTAPNTLTSDSECQEYKKGCKSNGHGCLDIIEPCSSYYGTSSICESFAGNNIRCTNIATADTFTACVNKSCEQNLTSQSDADCALWYYFGPEEKPQCVWTGTVGCVKLQPCNLFLGTIDTCALVTATDGPCYGTGSEPNPCLTNSSICINAPKTFNTDEQCRIWGSTCMTNGFGCILAASATCSSIIQSSACSIYKITTGLFCDLADQCTTKPLSCMGFRTASECNNIQVFGSKTYNCGWDVYLNICIELTCELLPVTLTTAQACSNIIPECTTNGAGCIKLGSCSTYDKFSCEHAVSTDNQKLCSWKESKCRPIQCTDNKVSKTDLECNNYLSGCRTTGLGCSSNFSCSIFTDPLLCTYDTLGYPCLWYISSNTKGKCIKYAQCTDIISSLHEDCQAANKLCTTNGLTCIGITVCSKILSFENCNFGIDGICGWFPAFGTTAASCALFTNCQAATGTTSQCQAWGSSCISNGTTCISKSKCQEYTTMAACGNAGTDGICIWVAPTGTSTTGTCRQQICSDAITNITTHTECAAFQASTACTSSGNACITQAPCSSYSVQASCVQGTDGVCIWAQETKDSTTTSKPFCRLKNCQDVFLTQSSECRQAIPGVKCVSDGLSCIPQQTCSKYTVKEACKSGGTDAACVFIPGANLQTPNVGSCVPFFSCENANYDQAACNSRSDACYFYSVVNNGTVTTYCSPHTCQTKALISSCLPFPSWDLSSYQICAQIGTNCTAGDPTSFNQQQCYINSLRTHSWNPVTNTCQICENIREQAQTNNLWEGLLKFIYAIIFLILN